MVYNYWSHKHVADRLKWTTEKYGMEVRTISEAYMPDMSTLRFKTFGTYLTTFPLFGLQLGGTQRRGWRIEYGCSLRRVRRQANGLAYASTLGWIRVEPQQRNAPNRRSEWKHESPDFSRGESQE
jgi:hypothetical protein